MPRELRSRRSRSIDECSNDWVECESVYVFLAWLVNNLESRTLDGVWLAWLDGLLLSWVCRLVHRFIPLGNVGLEL